MTTRSSTYIIRNRRNGGLESALRGVPQANMDLGLFQEAKVTEGIYTCGLAGYSIVTTNAASRYHGRVAVFHRPAPHFAVEVVQQFGPNVVGFQMVTVERRWYIVGCYLAPDDTLTIDNAMPRSKSAPWAPNCWWRGTLTPT